MPHSGILLPQHSREWRTPSQAQAKDCFGNENATRFRIRAKLNDGHIVWTGWFDDRDDADAFLYAVALGNLHQERSLWDLPSPSWRPGMGEQLSYEFATLVFLTSPTGSNQTYTSLSDWNNSNNTVETLAGGGSGAPGNGGYGSGAGGGGGGYSKISNFSFATPGTTTATYQIGGVTGNSWFNGATLGASSVGSIGGTTATSNTANGVGSTTSAVGTTKYAGGNGGGFTSGSNFGGGGGGGAAGPSGAGNVGAQEPNGGTTGAAGGSADAGSGGAGGTPAAGAIGGVGGNGTEWDSSHGSGGGGAGGGSTSFAGGAGGNYGGAGGGGGFSAGAAGLGIQGIIVLTYTPSFLAGRFSTNQAIKRAAFF